MIPAGRSQSAQGETLLLRVFPGAAEGMPRAALSLAAAGDLFMPQIGRNPERRRFLESLGIAENLIAAPRLYHSRVVLLAGEAGDWREGAYADGIISPAGGPIPAVTVADCMPIWFLDLKRGLCAALHSGWQGTGIAQSCLERMAAAWGTKPEDCSVILGPCIGSCCYRVDPSRAVQFMDAWGEDAAIYHDGSWRLDLAAANEALLRRLGLERSIRWTACTACDARFGSARRQGQGRFTRMLAFFLPGSDKASS